ncbi:membrane-spanning 4-domains subfamily A member 4A-like isoform X3 [Ahaetulla prasina]|uniref:membrane-spanning 4-domains subfamily A member 4A-like isoform X3 n=1 Tax=Ahaetulla prasina TaxID=499056 RepID=UPI002649018A|nr:membrane-spanning 4-domains subfamily A member 4A-like isoform X3 [Ahaetulla prasina]
MNSPVVMGKDSQFSSPEPDHPILVKKFYQGEPVALGYIISGSLTVAAARNPKIPLVKGMLAMNAISAITAGLGIILLSFSFSPLLPFDFGSICNYHRYDTKEKCDEIQNIGKGILVFLIVVNLLEFCISISVASFGCKMLCRDPFTETVVVVYRNVTPSRAKQDPPFDCIQPAIHPE